MPNTALKSGVLTVENINPSTLEGTVKGRGDEVFMIVFHLKSQLSSLSLTEPAAHRKLHHQQHLAHLASLHVSAISSSFSLTECL